MGEFKFNKEIAEYRKKKFVFNENTVREAQERRQKSALEEQKKREEQNRLANFQSNNKAMDFFLADKRPELKTAGANEVNRLAKEYADFLEKEAYFLNMDIPAQKKVLEDRENTLKQLEDLQSQYANTDTLKKRVESDIKYKESAGWDTSHDKGLLDEYNVTLEDIRKQMDSIGSVRMTWDEVNKLKGDIKYAEFKQGGKKLTDFALSAEDFETSNAYGKEGLFRDDAVEQFLDAFPDLNTNYRWEDNEFFTAMNEQEKKILGYYLGHKEYGLAAQYVNYLRETVGNKIAEQHRKDAETWYEKLGYAFMSGGDMFRQGIQGLGNAIVGNDGYTPPSPIQQGSSMIRQDIEDAEGLGNRILGGAYDVTSTTVNMLPSIALSIASPTAGAVLMGTTAGGNAYTQMINEGGTWAQAVGYGALVGTSEAVLERILGGIVGKEKIVGVLMPKLKKTASKVALKIGEDVISEFSEEALQTVLEPLFESWVTNTDYEAPEFEDVMYSGLLGAITGGMFTGGGIGGKSIANTVIERVQNAQIQSDLGESILNFDTANEDIKKLIDNAQQSGDKKLQKAANKVAKTEKDGTYDVSARKVGRLAQMSNEQLAQSLMDTATGNDLKSQTIEKLTESGMNQKGAERAFDLIVRDASRGSESKELQSLINKNPDIRTMYDNMVEYLSDEAVTKRVEDVAKASPVTEITNRIVDQRLKDAGIDVVNESVEKDDVVDVDHVDEDGIAYVKTESGKVIPYKSDSLSISSASHKKMGYASLFGTNGAKTYFALAPETESSRYMNDFTNLYKKGAKGESFSLIESNISADVQKAIYEAGEADRDAAIKSRQKAETEAKEKEATFVKKQMGFKSDRVTLSEEAVAKIKSVSDKGISDQYKAAVKVIDGLAKMLQVNINIVASETDANGNYIGAKGMYNRATNTFTFDIMSGMDNVADISYSAMIKTAGHELTHFIQNWSPSKYLTLKNTTLKFLKDQNDAAWITERLDEIRSDNEAIGKNLTLEQAKDELVADAFEDVLSNIDFAETILRTDKTLFDKIHSWVKKNVNDFKKNFGIAVKDVEANSEAATTMRKAGERAQALYNQWADAFSTALENSTSQQTDVDGDVQNQARSVDKYTKKEYNDFGWARANNILTAEENSELRSKFAAAKSNQTNPPKTKSGELMITLNVRVGNEYYENKIAYMKGTIRNPIITRIVEIDEYNETELAQIRSDLYEAERQGIRQTSGGIFVRYNSFDFEMYDQTKRSVSAVPLNNKQLGTQRGRSSKKTKRAVRFTDNEDGTITTYYSDGTIETEKQSFTKRDVKPDPDTQNQAQVTKEKDAAYMEAVNRGDTETAQRMVEEAAREAGYGVTTYHGTNKDFTVFKTLYYNEFGYHVGTKKAAEERVQYDLNSKVMKLYTKLGKTIRTPDVFGYFAGMHDYIFYVRGEISKVSDMDWLKQLGRTKKLGNKFPSNEVLDRLHKAYVDFVDSGYKNGNAVVELTQEYLKSIGVDSIEYRNAYENTGSTSYLLMASNQVKSADPITYDDNGNVIPLSERFNPENEDIRNQARKKTRFDVNTRLDLIETAKKNKIASDAASKGLILEYQRNLRSYQAAETTWRIARYHKDTDAIVAAATAMQLRRNTIASIECTKVFAELFGKLDIPYLVEETSAENGLSEIALQNAKEAVKKARQALSEAERDAIEWARRIDVAGQRVYDASMRRMRLENSQALNSVQNRIKQAMDKPNTRSSIPVGGKPLAEAIMRTAKELNKLMSSKSTFSPEAETIALIKEAAVIGAGGDVRTQSINRQDSINIIDKFGSQFKAEFKALSELYGNIKENKNLSFMYDEEIYMNLDQYSADKPDYDDVWSYIFDCARLVRAVAYDLTNANTIMVNKRAESYLELRGGLEYDFMHYAPKKMRKALVNAASSITLTPEVFLHAVFGHTESANKFYQIYDDGQNKYIDVVLAARGLFAEIEEMTDKNGKKLYGEADKKKLLSNEATIDLHMYDGDGNKVFTNEDHAISFILAAKNADYRRHIMYGGWAIPDLEKANKGKNAYLDGRTTEHILDGENDNGEIIEYVTVERGGKQIQIPRIDFTMIDNMRAEANRFQAIGEIDKAIDLRCKLALANQEIKKIESDWEKKILEAAGLAELHLSSYANACMQKLDIFYNNVAKAFLDEATEERYGFKKTLEKNHYYPIQVVKEQATQAELNTLVKQDYRVSALGSMKRRVRSRISCKLYGAVSSFAYNVENTAKYYGYLNTLNYIKKITGVSYDKMTDEKGKKKQTKEDIVTLGSYINRNLGNTVFTDYLYTLESDISGGKGMTTAADKALDFIYSGFVANALFFNISPTAKQLSALLLVYPDAGLSASIKGIIKGATTKGDAKGKTKFPMGLTEAQKRYVARYSRIYKYRSGGLVDADLSDFKQSNHPIARMMSKHPTLTGTNWMERTDSQVLGLQFYAILESVKKSNPNLSAQEAATKAGEILDKTIQHFQANSTVLQRAPLLRSKGSTGMSLARVTVGTFKSQQLTMLNAKIDSLLKVATLENQIKELEKSNKREDAEKLKTLKSELSRSKKYAARVAAATMVSYIINAAFTVAIQLLYKRTDDEDELWETYGWDLLQSYMSIVPGVGDAIYYLIEQLTDNGYYGDSFAEVGLLGVINDFVDVIGSIRDGEYTVDRIAKDIGKLVAPFGVPARNVWNIVKAIFKWIGVEIE